MKNLGIVLMVMMTIFLQSCFAAKTANRSREKISSYLIKSIESVGTWYVIYAHKKDSVFKIVVRKEKQASLNCKRLILVGESYRLRLHSRKDEVPVINGVKIKPMNSLDIQCYTYDESTVVCIDPKKGIYDLYYTPDIKGLCYVSNSAQ